MSKNNIVSAGGGRADIPVSTEGKGNAAMAFRTALPQTVPVLAGYVFLGITYGILMVTSGFPIIYPILTAIIVYTGSM